MLRAQQLVSLRFKTIFHNKIMLQNLKISLFCLSTDVSTIQTQKIQRNFCFGSKYHYLCVRKTQIFRNWLSYFLSLLKLCFKANINEKPIKNIKIYYTSSLS